MLSRLSGSTLVAQADTVYALLVDPEFESDVHALGMWKEAQNTVYFGWTASPSLPVGNGVARRHVHTSNQTFDSPRAHAFGNSAP